MRASLLLDVSRRRLAFTDVSGQRVGPIFKGESVFEGGTLKSRMNTTDI